jgi:hypothetical protein
MKKWWVVLAVLMLTAPAMAADWSFYGSQRMGTWYTQVDNGDTQVNGQTEDAATQWYFQGNSRVGAKVKTDQVSGRVELRLATEGKNASSGGDTTVQTRIAYGQWQFADNASLKVGKDYSPVTDNNMSNQAFDADNNLDGQGLFYGGRPSYLGLYLGDFEFAAITPAYGGDVNSTSGTSPNLNGVQGATNGEPDAYFPKLEAAYNWKFNAGYVRPFAGFQYYKIAPSGNGTVTDRLDIYSYALGASSHWNIGAFYLNGELAWGANWSSSSWNSGLNAASSSLPYLKTNGKDVADVYSWSALLVGGMVVSDNLKFEAGGGFRSDNASGAPGYSQKDDSWAVYAQAVITLAPGVYLVPEVGYYDYMDDVAGNDQGYKWYAGAKWQIDF